MKLAVACVATLAVAQAFVVPAPCGISSSRAAVAPLRMAENPTDPASIAALAEACVSDGCSVDAVDELLLRLRMRKTELSHDLTNVDSMIYKLEHLGKTEDASAMSSLIASIARLFSVNDDDYPAMSYPTGFSGDVSKGTKDAWDYKVSGKSK